MKTQTKNNVMFTLSLIVFFTACGSENDIGGKLWWTIFGFPFLGLAYFVGGLVISMFQSKDVKTKSDSPEPVSAIIVGLVVIFILYTLIKAIF